MFCNYLCFENDYRIPVPFYFHLTTASIIRAMTDECMQFLLSYTMFCSLFFFSGMESFDQDEVDTLNQAAQTARQRRAENFRRRKVVSEVYDAILKNDAGTQTVSLPLKVLVSKLLFQLYAKHC